MPPSIRGYAIAVLVSLAALFCAFLGKPAHAENRGDHLKELYLKELTARADRLELAQDPEWHNLLYYRRHPLFQSPVSLIDASEFFLSPEGKRNPRAELHAALASFFEPPPDSPNSEDSGTPTAEGEPEHPQCRFLARFAWLDGKLHFDRRRLTIRNCARFEQFYQALDPEGVTLVYPAAYLNNPASMFGHTFFRFDGPKSRPASDLLTYAASYAAVAPGAGGLSFAVKGLMGGYWGAFSVEPYYERVKKYSDLENRDIWEYRLSLTREETRRLLMHLWEVGQGRLARYYFFDENCSYYLLKLLEVVRPQLNLSAQFSLYAIPADTVRAISRSPGLVTSVNYRPALGTNIRYRAKSLPAADREFAAALADSSVDLTELLQQLRRQYGESEEGRNRRARILELAGEYQNYLVITNKLRQKEDRVRARQLLAERSRISSSLPPLSVPAPEIRPEDGHGVARAELSLGRESGRWFYQLGLRPAYHDLLDAEGGYTRGAQINFFNTAIRQYEKERLELERFLPLEIVSLTPRDEFFSPISWHVQTGLVRARTERDPPGKLVYTLRGGPGLTFEPFDRLLAYALSTASVLYGPSYPGDHYSTGGGATAGLLLDLSRNLRTEVRVEGLRYFLGEEQNDLSASLTLRYALGRDRALRLELLRRSEFDEFRNSAMISWHEYF